jgi:hypothetical protein
LLQLIVFLSSGLLNFFSWSYNFLLLKEHP